MRKLINEIRAYELEMAIDVLDEKMVETDAIRNKIIGMGFTDENFEKLRKNDILYQTAKKLRKMKTIELEMLATEFNLED